MKLSPREEFLALGVHLARKRRDKLAKKAKLKNYQDPTKSPNFEGLMRQDDVVQAHLRQLERSIRYSREENKPLNQD